jgi:hypothetical protein
MIAGDRTRRMLRFGRHFRRHASRVLNNTGYIAGELASGVCALET